VPPLDELPNGPGQEEVSEEVDDYGKEEDRAWNLYPNYNFKRKPFWLIKIWF